LFVSYTDIENLRNFPAAFQEGEEVVITEKIHGTNSRVGVVEGTYMAGSKELRRKQPGTWKENIYWFPFSLPSVQALFDEYHSAKQVILFGEVYGSKIQSLNYGVIDTLGYRAFDMLVDGKYLSDREFGDLCDANYVLRVPYLYQGPYSLDIVKRLSNGPTELSADHIREGVVVKPVVERRDPKLGRVILKYIGDEYLFGKGISDSEDR